MGSKTGLCGVILSAGASSRMGTEKALLPWPPNAGAGQTLLSAQIESLKPFAESVIVVGGRNYDVIAPIAIGHGASVVQNPEPERGQFSSLQIGLRELIALGYEAAIITLVDAPPLSSNSLEKLRSAFEQALAGGMLAVAPEHDGKRGHPLFASRNLIEAFLAAPPTSDARTVRREHAQFLVSLPVTDVLLAVDVNTPEQYRALAPREKTDR